ncbi:MAG: YqcI/YcgG family protein [Flavobacterium sp.]|nr:MAG: YqcI/YcgG family protein [Flavobacterium sp.]
MDNEKEVISEWMAHIENADFPCIAAKAAMVKEQLNVMVAGHMACPKDDREILKFIYDFVEKYRDADSLFHSAVVIFPQPDIYNEQMYDSFFWSRLQALSDLDAQNYEYDDRVDSNPESGNFSFSLKEEAFFVIGLHPASSRPARNFKYPVIVFNPHAQFEQLRDANQYGKMKNIIRKRDTALAGGINPMLEDFGEASEVYQYTGQKLDNSWKCPLHINHAGSKHNQSA